MSGTERLHHSFQTRPLHFNWSFRRGLPDNGRFVEFDGWRGAHQGFHGRFRSDWPPHSHIIVEARDWGGLRLRPRLIWVMKFIHGGDWGELIHDEVTRWFNLQRRIYKLYSAIKSVKEAQSITVYSVCNRKVNDDSTEKTTPLSQLTPIPHMSTSCDNLEAECNVLGMELLNVLEYIGDSLDYRKITLQVQWLRGYSVILIVTNRYRNCLIQWTWSGRLSTN